MYCIQTISQLLHQPKAKSMTSLPIHVFGLESMPRSFLIHATKQTNEPVISAHVDMQWQLVLHFTLSAFPQTFKVRRGEQFCDGFPMKLAALIEELEKILKPR